MTQRRDVDTYHLTLSELLHEVCVELLDGQDMLEDLSAQRRAHQDMDQAEGGSHAPAVYEFAEEQIRLRLQRYRELGDRIDEIITLYNELADEALAEDDEEVDETFSYTGDADWLEWQKIKSQSEDDDDEYEEDDDDNHYETDDDPDEEGERVQEWSLKKKKKKNKKDKKAKKDKNDKKKTKRKDKSKVDENQEGGK